MLAYRISRIIALPVIGLTEKVSSLHGDNLDFEWYPTTEYEIQALAEAFMSLTGRIKNYIEEVKQIAIRKGIQGMDNLEKDALDSFAKMSGEGKTSMFQDVLAKRPTEIDIFCGEIIKSGEKYGVQTPYNQVLYDLIKIKEEDNEYSLHSCQGRK